MAHGCIHDIRWVHYDGVSYVLIGWSRLPKSTIGGEGERECGG